MNLRIKQCKFCGKEFVLHSPNNQYCSDECKIKARKKYDRERSRKRNAYIEYKRTCLICGKEFTTYYKKKIYCGSEFCEKERIRRKNATAYLGRDKEQERIRKREYYNKNIELCRLRKALKYREIHGINTPYKPRGFYSHTEEFVSDYVAKFGYKLVSDYKNNKSRITLICPEGHEWKTTFHRFKDANARCFYCYLENNYTSRPEQKLLYFFESNYSKVEIIHHDRKQIPPLELDLYFPKYKIAVEVCGLYWHSEISGQKPRDYHYNKMMKCYEKGIRLFTVFEDEISDKFDIVLSRILTALNLIDNKIYARKCDIKEISITEANKFYRVNHIQGATQGDISWGLFFDGELVQACTIGPVIRKHAGNEKLLELKRLCSKNFSLVVGGFSKLFKSVIEYSKLNNIQYIKSYCDMRYANIFNPVYETIGFKLIGLTKYTPHYIKNRKRYRNISLRKTKDERLTGLTEFELRLRQGYDRIWDCGHRTYLYEVY